MNGELSKKHASAFEEIRQIDDDGSEFWYARPFARVLGYEDFRNFLAVVAKSAGVIAPLDYAIFQNHGYQGLYGGLDARGIHQKKGLKKSQQILDHMGSTELAANLFRATQTEEKLRRENTKGKQKANQTHYNVGKKVR